MKDTTTKTKNSASIAEVFHFLERFLAYRLSKELTQEPLDLPEFDLKTNQSHLSTFISEKKLTDEEIVLLLLALVPSVSPGFLNTVVANFFT